MSSIFSLSLSSCSSSPDRFGLLRVWRVVRRYLFIFLLETGSYPYSSSTAIAVVVLFSSSPFVYIRIPSYITYIYIYLPIHPRQWTTPFCDDEISSTFYSFTSLSLYACTYLTSFHDRLFNLTHLDLDVLLPTSSIVLPTQTRHLSLPVLFFSQSLHRSSSVMCAFQTLVHWVEETAREPDTDNKWIDVGVMTSLE